tara:strand:+ start:31577 stop:32152 length:576 start_codon:yes stop_codon:yes gene_type:complete
MIMTADTNLYLNKDSLSLDLFEYRDEAFASLPVQEFKYKRWDWAFDKGVHKSVQPLLEKMLDMMSLIDDKGMRWLVDYKVRDLKVGDCGCILEGWHLDVVSNPNHKSNPDHHLIYSTEFGTDFVAQPIEYTATTNHFNSCLSDLDAESLPYVTAKPSHISAYNRFQLHRGPIVTRDCRRMLLRLTATEVVR